MKTVKILIAIIIIAILGVCNAHAQVRREGNTFKQETTRTTTKDTLVTKFNFEDSQGKTYEIILNKKSGSCYVWKQSKSGKMYKQYMQPEVCSAVSKEYGVTYTPRKR